MVKLYPLLPVRDVEAAVEFYCRAFDAVEEDASSPQMGHR